jgi:small subunit ribosomal protein S17
MRKLKGTITSTKMHKTVVIRVDRLKKHPRYHKYYRVSKRFKAHAQEGDYLVGDQVIIQETRPMSKEKRWRVVELVKRPGAEEAEEVAPS